MLQSQVLSSSISEIPIHSIILRIRKANKQDEVILGDKK